jgi:hypothetical protein
MIACSLEDDHRNDPPTQVKNMTRQINGAEALHSSAVAEFLLDVLAGGGSSVFELEAMARTAGLLGERQRITDAKSFKAAKKMLAINSRRDGFGRGGGWFWVLPPTPKTTVVETAADNAPKVSVNYGGDHFLPPCVPKVPPAVAYDEGPRLDSSPDVSPGVAYDEGQNRQVTPHTHGHAKGDLVLLEWVNGVACLDLARAPRGLPPHRWRMFVVDSLAFLTSSERWAPAPLSSVGLP